MTDQRNPELNAVHPEERFRGRRGSGNNELGGFKIYLSDNEMKAARAVQEAFGLKSTIAALGFAIRTTAQMLLEGKLDDLVLQQRNQTESSGNKYERTQNNSKERRDINRIRLERRNRPDPLARPSKPNLNLETDSIHEETRNSIDHSAPSISNDVINVRRIDFPEQISSTGV